MQTGQIMFPESSHDEWHIVPVTLYLLFLIMYFGKWWQNLAQCCKPDSFIDAQVWYSFSPVSKYPNACYYINDRFYGLWLESQTFSISCGASNDLYGWLIKWIFLTAEDLRELLWVKPGSVTADCALMWRDISYDGAPRRKLSCPGFVRRHQVMS